MIFRLKTKPFTHDSQESRDERRDEVLSGPGADDGVVRARDGGPVVGGDHEAHLEEGTGVGREAALEPEEGEDAADAHLLLEDLRDGHARVDQLLAALVADRGHERGRLPDQTQLPET